MLNEEQIKGKWSEIKGGIRNLWGQITDDELEKTKGNIQSVSGIVERKYGETKESIKTKLDSLMNTFDNETDKSLKLNDGESSYQRNPIAERTSTVSQNQDQNSDMRTRSPERAAFDKSEGGAINTKQSIAGNKDNEYNVAADEDSSDDEYDAEEIFDDSTNESQTYESKMRH